MSQRIYILIKKDDKDNQTTFYSAEDLYNLIINENIEGDVYEYDSNEWTKYHNVPFYEKGEYPEPLDNFSTEIWITKILTE